MTLSGGTMDTTSWHHLVGVYDGSNASFYVDGRLVAGPTPVAGFSPNTTVPLRLGATTIPSRTYDGWVDEVAFYGKALDAATIAAHYSTATTDPSGYAAQVLAGAPLGYWPLDEPAYTVPAPSALPVALNLGSLAAAANGAYQPGSLPGAPGVPSPGFGDANRSCQFNGTGAIDVAGNGLNITGALTISAWVKASPANGQYQAIIGKGSDSYQLGLDGSGYPRFSDGAQAFGQVGGAGRIDDGQWHQLVGVYDGGNSESLYVDGQLAAVNNSASAVRGSSNDLIIGGGTTDGTNQVFNGWVDEVALFPSALTSGQVGALFSAASKLPGAPAPVLQAGLSAGGALSLSWNAISGQTYQVQYKTDLNQSTWTNLGGAITATGANAAFSDAGQQDRQRFYRVILLP